MGSFDAENQLTRCTVPCLYEVLGQSNPGARVVWIAARLAMGTPGYLHPRLYRWRKELLK